MRTQSLVSEWRKQQKEWVDCPMCSAPITPTSCENTQRQQVTCAIKDCGRWKGKTEKRKNSPVVHASTYQTSPVGIWRE